MTRLQVAQALCQTCSKVADERFKNSEPADCFCGHCEGWGAQDYRFSAEVLAFVENAVKASLEASKSVEEITKSHTFTYQPLHVASDHPSMNLLIEAWSQLCELSQERALTPEESKLYDTLAGSIVKWLSK